MKKILALLLALAMLLCACGNDPEPAAGETEKTTAPSEESTAPSEETTAPSEETTAPSEESTEPSGETTAPTLPTLGTSETHVLAGLSYTLTGNFEELFQDDTSASYMSENLSVDVGFGAMAEVGEGITDSAAFAQYFRDEMLELFGETFDEVTLGERSGVSYILLHNEAEPQTMVMGFYVCGEAGWTIGVSGFEPDLDVETMIDMATSGIIDETGIPELPETVPPEDAEPMEQTFQGLTFMLDTSFQMDFEDDFIGGYSNALIYVEATCEDLALLDAGITDAASYAHYVANMLGQDTVFEANGVCYVTLEIAEFDQTAVYGFYVSGDVGWMLSAIADQAELEDQLIAIATSGTIDESAIPEIEVPELPEASQTMSFQGLTLTLPGVATPIYVDEMSLYFNYEGIDFGITVGTQAELPGPAADSADLAAQQQNLNEGVWEELTVDSRNGVSYMQGRDADGFTYIVACYVSGDRWWMVSAMDYLEDVDAIIDLVTAATID